MSALEEELNTLRPKLQEIKTKETVVRSYEGAVDWLSTDMRAQINQCLIGAGPCLTEKLTANEWVKGMVKEVGNVVTLGLLNEDGTLGINYTKLSTDKEKNNAVIDSLLQGTRAKVNKDKQKLEAAGLTEQAKDLERRMKNIENETTFQRRCPNSKTHYISGRGLESGQCPP